MWFGSPFLTVRPAMMLEHVVSCIFNISEALIEVRFHKYVPFLKSTFEGLFRFFSLLNTGKTLRKLLEEEEKLVIYKFSTYLKRLLHFLFVRSLIYDLWMASDDGACLRKKKVKTLELI